MVDVENQLVGRYRNYLVCVRLRWRKPLSGWRRWRASASRRASENGIVSWSPSRAVPHPRRPSEPQPDSASETRRIRGCTRGISRSGHWRVQKISKAAVASCCHGKSWQTNIAVKMCCTASLKQLFERYLHISWQKIILLDVLSGFLQLLHPCIDVYVQTRRDSCWVFFTVKTVVLYQTPLSCCLYRVILLW